MRDKNRIKPFLESIASIWEQNPDLRFGQLVSNVYSFGGNLTYDGEYVNEDHAIFEYYDLIATIEMLYSAGGLPQYESEVVEALKKEKKQNVEKYWNERIHR